MATVKELKEWLNRFPEDTIVKIGIQEQGQGYESYGCVKFKELNLEDKDIGSGWEFADLRNNRFVKKNEPYFNKCFLYLGESC